MSTEKELLSRFTSQIGFGMHPCLYALRRALLGRRAWLAVPAATGLGWQYHFHQQKTLPIVPPVRPPLPAVVPNTTLIQHVWEYILTAKRFIYLFFLFVPVLVSSPILLVGKPQKSLRGDRWGAVWWYGLLVSRMEAAGPTFIKVRGTIQFTCATVRIQFLSAGSMGRFKSGSLSCFAL